MTAPRMRAKHRCSHLLGHPRLAKKARFLSRDPALAQRRVTVGTERK